MPLRTGHADVHEHDVGQAFAPRGHAGELFQGVAAVSRRAVTPEQRDARQRLGALSPREREVAGLVAQGLTNAEIAGRLFIQPDSVKKSVTRILGKLGLRDRVQLVIILRDAPDAPM